MPLLPVFADRPGLGLDPGALETAIGRLTAEAPVVAMIHGFRFAPGVSGACPHQHILSLHPNSGAGRVVSWPRHLRLCRPGTGLALAFGWPSRGTIWSAHASASRSGVALAHLVTTVRRIDPDRRVNVIAHSLGARVALAALAHLDGGAIDRMILMAPAEFRSTAEHAMATAAGRRAEVVSVTSRENDMFDFLLETLLSAGTSVGLGHGLSKPRSNWINLQVDQTATVRALAGLGFRMGSARTRVCHWSPYLRPGLFALYRAFLHRRIGLDDLQTVLPPELDARWSRLLRPTMAQLPYPGTPA